MLKRILLFFYSSFAFYLREHIHVSQKETPYSMVCRRISTICRFDLLFLRRDCWSPTGPRTGPPLTASVADRPSRKPRKKHARCTVAQNSRPMAGRRIRVVSWNLLSSGFTARDSDMVAAPVLTKIHHALNVFLIRLSSSVVMSFHCIFSFATRV